MEASLTDVYHALQVVIGALGILSGLVFTLLWRGKWFS